MYNKYYVRQIGKIGAWHVIAPNGLPVYDEALYGNDKPVIFRDLDVAGECAHLMNTLKDSPEMNPHER